MFNSRPGNEKKLPKLDVKTKILSDVGLEYGGASLKCFWLKLEFQEKGKKVGSVSIKFLPEKKVAFVSNLQVEEEFRSTKLENSKGYGTVIRQEIEKKIKRYKAIGILTDGLFSGADENHESLRGWYERHNWHEWPIGVLKQLYFSGREIELKEFKEIDLLLRVNYRRQKRKSNK